VAGVCSVTAATTGVALLVVVVVQLAFSVVAFFDIVFFSTFLARAVVGTVVAGIGCW